MVNCVIVNSISNFKILGHQSNLLNFNLYRNSVFNIHFSKIDSFNFNRYNPINYMFSETES